MKFFNNIPFISSGQMREVDRVMIEDYGITFIQMMENAGRRAWPTMLYAVFPPINLFNRICYIYTFFFGSIY